MKLLTHLLLSVMVIFVFSCGGEKSDTADDIKTAVDMVKNMPDMAEKVDNIQTRAKKRWEERKELGDTVAMNYKELQKFLPKEVPGFTAEKPTGESLNMPGMSYSQAEQHFVKEENGKRTVVRVTIVDYNSAASMFSTAAAVFANNISFEDDNGYSRSIDVGVKDCYGHEEYSNKRRHASIMIAAGYRFIVSIEADNQDNADYLKDFVKYIDLEKLAKL